MIKIVYELECHCGSAMTLTSVDLSNPQPDGSILIDLDMAVGQQEFSCADCGCVTFTSDLDTEAEPDHCPLDTD